MSGWVKVDEVSTYTTDKYIAVVSGFENENLDMIYDYAILTNDANYDVVWSSDRDSGINYYFSEKDAKEKAIGTLVNLLMG